jgi:drug/metabolite transporter (DMT)-like permease
MGAGRVLGTGVERFAAVVHLGCRRVRVRSSRRERICVRRARAPAVRSPKPGPSELSARSLTLMLTAVAAFAGMSACVKILREHGMSTPETVVYRMAPGLPVLWLIMRPKRAPLRPRRAMLVGGRTVLGALSMACSFFAVQGLSLLQHTVLHLAQPVFVAGLSPLVLRERLRGTAALALGLALLGALMVIRPDRALAELGLVSPMFGAVGLGAAVFSAFAHLTIRMATGLDRDSRRSWASSLTDSPREAPETIVFHFALWSSVAGLVAGWGAGGFRSLPATLAPSHAAMAIAGMAGLGLVGQLLMSRAYALSPAPRVAMVGYAGIPISLAIDVLAWGAPANPSALVGAVVMVLAGALLLARGPD